MLALFFTVICERCEASREPPPTVHRGYVIWRRRPPGSTEYVFRHRDGADQWRRSAGLARFAIRAVIGSAPFSWRTSTGSVAGIELAEGVYEVYPDDRHELGPRRVHLDPDPSY
jgi:hypothetical protein